MTRQGRALWVCGRCSRSDRRGASPMRWFDRARERFTSTSAAAKDDPEYQDAMRRYLDAMTAMIAEAQVTAEQGKSNG